MLLGGICCGALLSAGPAAAIEVCGDGICNGNALPPETLQTCPADCGGAPPPPPGPAVTDADLAYRWAPVHYQDTDSTDYDADYLTSVDFDGDWSALNNWESQDDSLSWLTAKVYYSVVETSTHWFIVYGFYHPRDWCDSLFCDFHENDMEGVLLTVRRNGTTYGALEAAVSVAHKDFYSYIPSGSPYTNGQEDIDGRLLLQTHDGASHPTTFQEAKGHGVYRWDGSNFPGGDGVVYFPDRTTAEVPSGGNDRFVRYTLVNIFVRNGLWAHRCNTSTFTSCNGPFRGDNGSPNNAASPSWRWDDHDDGGSLLGGELARDPAKLVSIYFGNEGTFSRTYTRNGYL